MSAIKKANADSLDQLNDRIQRRFDLVFKAAEVKRKINELPDSESLSMTMGESFSPGDIEMSSSANKKDSGEAQVIDLDFTIEDELSEKVQPVKEVTSPSNKNTIGDDNGLDFALNFNEVDDLVPEKMPPSIPSRGAENTSSGITLGPNDTNSGFSLEGIEPLQDSLNENTQKTIVINSSALSKVDLQSFSLDQTEELQQGTADLMSTEEAKANIESTIKDIIRPKKDATLEFDVSMLSASDKTPSDGFTLPEFSTDHSATHSTTKDLNIDDDEHTGFTIDDSLTPVEGTSEFNLDSFKDAIAPQFSNAPYTEVAPRREQAIETASPIINAPQASTSYEREMRVERVNDEDSVRFHATIRQLREEREELLGQIKAMKVDQRELEQDNLSLKAGLDEAKIEISILRKRHMVELEDMKYRLTLSEEKKALAEEKARQAEQRREKLEQKVRIDYNQVKLREKELESKLEMLTMDIDSQVHGRDQKILELRRKIDALEFNMENASIKEQRSNEDKRRLEDKLNKIMTTLRHSIKNLEEDIDLAQEDVPTSEKN